MYIDNNKQNVYIHLWNVWNKIRYVSENVFFFLETNIILYFTLRTSRIIMYIIKNICVFLPDDAIFCSRRYNITY